MEMNKQNIDEELKKLDEFHLMLARNFAENNAGRHCDIVTAINANDIALAHRLAHNLKSNAGQLRRSALQKAASDVENNLENGVNRVTAQQLQILDTELKSVIETFKTLTTQTSFA